MMQARAGPCGARRRLPPAARSSQVDAQASGQAFSVTCTIRRRRARPLWGAQREHACIIVEICQSGRRFWGAWPRRPPAGGPREARCRDGRGVSAQFFAKCAFVRPARLSSEIVTWGFASGGGGDRCDQPDSGPDPPRFRVREGAYREKTSGHPPTIARRAGSFGRRAEGRRRAAGLRRAGRPAPPSRLGPARGAPTKGPRRRRASGGSRRTQPALIGPPIRGGCVRRHAGRTDNGKKVGRRHLAFRP